MTEVEISRLLAHHKVPDHLRPGLAAHILHGRPVGGFITACLRNDLLTAVCSMAVPDFAGLKAVAVFLHNDAPGGCWGDGKAVAAWRKRGGLKGKVIPL